MGRRMLLPLLLLMLGVLILLTACKGAPTPSKTPTTPLPESEVTPVITPEPAMPTPAAITTAPQTFVILADRGWDSVGMFVRQGQQFEITATGSWSIGFEENASGPGGMDRFEPDSILPSVPIGTLIGRIGDNHPFEIGEHAIKTADFGGELHLSINDHPEALSDNTGSLEVSVAFGPGPTIPTQLLTNEVDGYRLLVPIGYQSVIYEKGMCLTKSEAWMMACHVANAFIEVDDASGRTLSQVADELAATGNPDIEVKRTSLKISGAEAILLDDIYTYSVLRKVVIVNDDRVYILTFVPWNEEVEDFSRLEDLYNTVIGSFAILPSPDVVASPPAESSPIPTPSSLDLRVDSVLISYSPDGLWKAEVLLASQYDPLFMVSELQDYVLLKVYRVDGSQVWTPYEEWSETGIGDSFVSGMYWSANGRYLYFTHVGVMHPCGYPFATNLHRFDLIDGSLTEIPLTGLGLGNISISPGAGRLAYRTDMGILVTDLESGGSHLYPYRWPENSIADNYAWSPEGQRLAFNFIEDFCDFSGKLRSSIMTLDLDSGAFWIATGPDLAAPLVLGWPEPNKLLVDKEGEGFFDLESGTLVIERTSPEPITIATWKLQEFLNSLYWRDDYHLEFFSYERAAELYGGSYEILMTMNPDVDPDDHITLLRNACEANGFQCLRLREVLSTESETGEDGLQTIIFTVNLMNPDGSVFSLGPCCGEDPAGAPQTEFIFTVRQVEDDVYKVLELPPYMP